MGKVIDLSQPETWPNEIIADLDASFTILSEHEKRRIRSAKSCQNNILARSNPPELIYSQKRSLLLQRIDSYLNTRYLLGFHCTRLHESEIKVVKENGLKPLSKQLAYGKVQRLQRIGVIPTEIASNLLSQNAVNDKHGKRLGKLHFIFSRSSLKDESCVSRLLSYWGGEALYWAHENTPEVATVLKNVGCPCIVQAKVPIAMLNSFSSVSEKLVSTFLHTRGVLTTDNGLLEGCIDQALTRDRIQRIIEYGEPEFETLTNCGRWQSPISSLQHRLDGQPPLA